MKTKKAFVWSPVGPPRSRIKRYPYSRSLESAWFKIPGDKRGLFPAKMTERNRRSVYFDLEPTARSTLHTHLGNQFRRNTDPSAIDLREIFSNLDKDHKIRFWHIGSLDRRANVKGVLTLHATREFVKYVWEGDSYLGALKEVLDFSVNKDPLKSASAKLVAKDAGKDVAAYALKEMQRYGLVVRAWPRTGYRFEDGHFVLLKKGKSTRKLSARPQLQPSAV